jgi:hypothetical protein
MSKEHIVQAGDCIASIAYENGFFWKTLWEHPDNAELKQKRTSPFLLVPGDVVKVPDLRVEDVSKPAEAKHRFKLKGVPSVLIVVARRHKKPKDEPAGDDDSGPPQDEPERATLKDPEEKDLEEEPDANVDYRLEIGSKQVTGKADGDGKIKISLMPDVRTVTIVLAPGTQQERSIELNVGGLDPIETLNGVAQRLNNLGWGPVELANPDDERDPTLMNALGEFQRSQDLSPNGLIDDATRNKLKEVHGS